MTATVGRCAALLGSVSLLACAAARPQPFTSACTAADAAYERGDYAAAAARWHDARALAPNARERDEVVYREAAARERAGDRAGAEAIYGELERGSGERAARAAYARAESVLRRMPNAETGYELLYAAIVRFPNSGLARNAVRNWLDRVARTRGAAAEWSELERLRARLAGSELDEALAFMRASWLERHGEIDRARSAYLDVARRFPYPRGLFWDDALVASSRLAEAQGQYRDAISDLERLLAEREVARMTGSYERAAYASARFHIAEIYRDHLDDRRRARTEFRRVWSDHPTSRLRDDALFEEALLATADHDVTGACDAMRHLLEAEPESRFSGCAAKLCPTLPREGTCRRYIELRISATPASPPTAMPEPHSSSSR